MIERSATAPPATASVSSSIVNWATWALLSSAARAAHRSHKIRPCWAYVWRCDGAEVPSNKRLRRWRGPSCQRSFNMHRSAPYSHGGTSVRLMRLGADGVPDPRQPGATHQPDNRTLRNAPTAPAVRDPWSHPGGYRRPWLGPEHARGSTQRRRPSLGGRHLPAVDGPRGVRLRDRSASTHLGATPARSARLWPRYSLDTTGRDC